MIRVFIADDQHLVRSGIRALLEMHEGIEIAGEAADGEETIASVPASNAGILLLDVRMPRKDGLDVLHALAAQRALPPTLVLTTFDDSHVVLECIRAGARGFMLKDVTYEQLIRAIHTIDAGDTIFQPAVTERLLRSREPKTELSKEESLTDRERQVVRLMAGGYSNKEIAHALGTAEGTVKNHVANIFAKFDVRDRTRAVLKALESGLLS